MKSLILKINLVLRNSKKRLSMIVFVLINLIQLSACHNQSSIRSEVRGIVVDQTSRINHASEILQDNKVSSELNISKAISSHLLHQSLTFEQIKAYIRTQNPNLDSEKLARAITTASRKYNYDPIFLLAIIKTESRFNPNAVGKAGEIGLMQIKPSTAEWIAKKKRFPWVNKDELFNPEYNIHMGALYFKYLKKSLNSKASDYINAYNMGPKKLRRLPAAGGKDHPYFERVVKNYISIYQSFENTNS
jgi:soluble lytic murein transglycosylase